jgi:predicted helicase
MGLHEVLDKYNKEALSLHDKGNRFERLMQAYLKTDPEYANQFKHVWMWRDFPCKKDFGGSDTGIDLVAQTFAGDFWAIQCKFYDPDTSITKPDVDTFLATSSRTFLNDQLQTTGFVERLFISTTSKWNINAEKAIENQNPPVQRISMGKLEDAPVRWETLDAGIYGTEARVAPKELRPYQQEAVDKVHEYFKTNERGKLIMACGSGKTFVSLRIAERETKSKGLVLFLVPSISLLGQTLREWTSDALEPFFPICICSDPEISTKSVKLEDSDLTQTLDLGYPATTNVEQIIQHLAEAKLNKKNGMTVVFSTYQDRKSVV